jgi:hypothetical protein
MIAIGVGADIPETSAILIATVSKLLLMNFSKYFLHRTRQR